MSFVAFLTWIWEFLGPLLPDNAKGRFSSDFFSLPFVVLLEIIVVAYVLWTDEMDLACAGLLALLCYNLTLTALCFYWRSSQRWNVVTSSVLFLLGFLANLILLISLSGHAHVRSPLVT